MNKVRLSYSMISAWERGDPQGAVDVFSYEKFGIEKAGTRQMEEGKKFHLEIAESIEKTNNLPKYMDFKADFSIPEIEKLVTVPYNEICDIGCRYDCIDVPFLYDWKTGVTDSLEWTRTNQLPIYFLIAELNGMDEINGLLDSAYIVRYNQYEKRTDYCKVHNSPKIRDKARNVIDSVCYDIWNYLNGEGLL